MYTVRRILSKYEDVYLETLPKLRVCWGTCAFIDLNEVYSSCHRRNWNQKVQGVPWVSDSAKIHWQFGIWSCSVHVIFAGLSLNSVVKWNLFYTYTTDCIRSVLMLLEEGAVHNSTGSLVNQCFLRKVLCERIFLWRKDFTALKVEEMHIMWFYGLWYTVVQLKDCTVPYAHPNDCTVPQLRKTTIWKYSRTRL